METDRQLREVMHKARGAPDTELQELQELGQQHYRAKEYPQALRCFTEALEFGPRAPISILDNRAATYIKLNNLDAALNDGRKMIQKEKRNCTGYLRTGQILQLYNNQKMALEIYEMGMRKVPNASSQFNKLKEVHNKLKLQLVQLNPVDILPIEIVEMILKFLQFEEIVKLTRVSKSWHTLLVAMPSLWTNLDFVRAKNPAKIETVRTYIKRANRNVTRAAVDKFGPSRDAVARCITSTCPALQELRMNGGYFSSSLLKNSPCSTSLRKLYASSQCRITIDTVSEIFRDCPNLENLEVHDVSPIPWQFRGPLWSSLPHLHSLILKGESAEDSGSLNWDDLLAAIPNIRDLTIGTMEIYGLIPNSDFDTLHKLESLDVSNVNIYFPLKLPSSIHTLTLGRSQRIERTIECDASRLVRLSLPHGLERSDARLLDILDANKGNLIYLHIKSSVFDGNLYRRLADEGYLAKVEELKFNDVDAGDELAIAIAKNCPALKRLSLAATKVSGVGVKAIVTALEGKLEYLNLNLCQNMGYDAVEWARSKGVRVAFGLADHRRGGKKIREGWC